MNATDLLTTGSPRARMINLPLYKKIIIVRLLLVTQIFSLVPWGHHNESSTLEGLSQKRGETLLPLLPKSGKAHVERSHPLLKNSYKNPPFMIYWLIFTHWHLLKPMGLGHCSKCRAWLGYYLVLGSLFEECPHPEASPYAYTKFLRVSKRNDLCLRRVKEGGCSGN